MAMKNIAKQREKLKWVFFEIVRIFYTERRDPEAVDWLLDVYGKPSIKNEVNVMLQKFVNPDTWGKSHDEMPFSYNGPRLHWGAKRDGGLWVYITHNDAHQYRFDVLAILTVLLNQAGLLWEQEHSYFPKKGLDKWVVEWLEKNESSMTEQMKRQFGYYLERTEGQG
jgi:hypothetical protein